jgi:hypothetical protein
MASRISIEREPSDPAARWCSETYTRPERSVCTDAYMGTSIAGPRIVLAATSAFAPPPDALAEAPIEVVDR